MSLKVEPALELCMKMQRISGVNGSYVSQNRNEILVKQGGTAEVKPFGPFDRSDQQGSDGFFISTK